jgi:hypothetical protein
MSNRGEPPNPTGPRNDTRRVSLAAGQTRATGPPESSLFDGGALLLQALDTLPQLTQLHALGAGQPVIALPAVTVVLALPVAKRLRRHPQRPGDIRDRATLTNQLQRLPPELLRIGRPRLAYLSPSFQWLSPQELRTRKIGGIPRQQHGARAQSRGRRAEAQSWIRDFGHGRPITTRVLEVPKCASPVH